ncbi:glycoside hydrolase family 3 protein [Filimonas effusa]|uniref:Glycoside hydrolase family 3 protein n=2 Tax=Filimonas effusa TaxID=2508721 RepID=A0A4Q1D6E2_9BACT|nr:glycoside hydrolase family 3 protein [Filimonas effusa]
MKGLMSLAFASLGLFAQAQQKLPFRNASLPMEQRVEDLVARMTLEEKVGQMMYNSPAIPRLQITAYNWWNEGLHGVARSGVATVFPQAIGLAASFDSALAFRVADVISDEARAMYNAAVAQNHYMKYGGLTFWTPNINIFRDPRWGRGQETYGEDPILTSKMGVAFVKGLQGNDPRYLKVAACAKHYAVHSGPERLRHEFNAVASPKDLRETYLPAFKALVDAGVEAVMCAYNATNGEPCCGNTFLLQDVLRKEWNFKGHVVSDCWAIADFYSGHKVVKNSAEASALAVKRGVNINCGDEFPALIEAVKQKLITEQEIDSALIVALKTRFRLGMFDDAADNHFNKLGTNIINSAAHRALAREAAVKSIVLLKNNGALPLKNNLSKYFVTGPGAANIDVLLGNYYGISSSMVTVLEGLAAQVAPGSQLQYRPGCMLVQPNTNTADWASNEAHASDATIMVMGISGLLEGEEGESIASPTFGDRLDYNIPATQIDYLKKLKKDNQHPVIAVITGGSPMNLAEVHAIADAVLMVWYPGEEGGNAVADIIFGKTSPSGKLPVTFPKSLDQLPPYENYDMQGRTYRFMKAEPMYPFGFGLSYTTFSYKDIKLSWTYHGKKAFLSASATVTNTGTKKSDEIVQLYVSHESKPDNAPLLSLKDCKRITLEPGASQKVSFSMPSEMYYIINDAGEAVAPPGKARIIIGGSQPGARSKELGSPATVEAELTIHP